MEPVFVLGILLIGLVFGGLMASMLAKGGARGPNLAASEAELAEFKARIEERDSAIKDLRRQVDAERASADKLQEQLDGLSEKVAASEGESLAVSAEGKGITGSGLPAMIGDDQKHAKKLGVQARAILAELDAAAVKLARDALLRFDKRSSRLVARARLAKIDVVLGRKRGLEAEVDAIRQGVLPKSAIDSLDAARYLEDGEEYWPFEGDDWPDEFVGSEGLK